MVNITDVKTLLKYNASGEVTAGALKDDSDEERVVNSFANLLIILFRQNSWLLDYLQKKLIDNDQNT